MRKIVDEISYGLGLDHPHVIKARLWSRRGERSGSSTSRQQQQGTASGRLALQTWLRRWQLLLLLVQQQCNAAPVPAALTPPPSLSPCLAAVLPVLGGRGPGLHQHDHRVFHQWGAAVRACAASLAAASWPGCGNKLPGPAQRRPDPAPLPCTPPPCSGCSSPFPRSSRCLLQRVPAAPQGSGHAGGEEVGAPNPAGHGLPAQSRPAGGARRPQACFAAAAAAAAPRRLGCCAAGTAVSLQRARQPAAHRCCLPWSPALFSWAAEPLPNHLRPISHPLAGWTRSTSTATAAKSRLETWAWRCWRRAALRQVRAPRCPAFGKGRAAGVGAGSSPCHKVPCCPGS